MVSPVNCAPIRRQRPGVLFGVVLFSGKEFQSHADIPGFGASPGTDVSWHKLFNLSKPTVFCFFKMGIIIPSLQGCSKNSMT